MSLLPSPSPSPSPSLLISLLLLGIGCSTETGPTYLPNGDKEDSLAATFRLTESSDELTLAIRCEGLSPCDGELNIQMLAPDVCALIADPGCGLGRIDPQLVPLANVTVTSKTEGVRPLSLRLETRDGFDFSASLAASFHVEAESDVEFRIEKSRTIESLTIRAGARWDHVDDSFVPASELELFLDTLPGVTYEEIGAAQSGYRSYHLTVEQPLDHNDADGRTLPQQVVLHHQNVEAPMVLYTSGYGLFSTTNLSESTQLMRANQISTEQRFFGFSRPSDLRPEDWRHLRIEQAAADHHRIVSMLRPFYNQSWLSTGHSKGGMTSVFHRRFFPDDVEATLAYVAPISFRIGDPRYGDYLDAIGTDDCRDQFQVLQERALDRADFLQPLAEEDALSFGHTQERYEGGHPAAWEQAVTAIDWGFWQRESVNNCHSIEAALATDEQLQGLVSGYVGTGYSDASWEDETFAPYYYQAAAQLGIQRLGGTHLDPLRKFPELALNLIPDGVPAPEFDPNSMVEIQQWVQSEAEDIVFLYGENDPWTGGAYDIGDNDKLLKVVAPGANHSALLQNLSDADRALAIQNLEESLGVRFDLGRTPISAQPPIHASPFVP